MGTHKSENREKMLGVVGLSLPVKKKQAPGLLIQPEDPTRDKHKTNKKEQEETEEEPGWT